MSANERPKLLVFLGNTGSRYARTRHNAGWMLLDREPFSAVSGWQRKFKAEWARTTFAGADIVLLKPQTMMNMSGESVQAAARFFRFSPPEVMVAHDEVELKFGQVGLRRGGGLAGHNGLRSIANCLATREFWRVRIGVGRSAHGDLHDHVLGRFASDEEGSLPTILDGTVSMIESCVESGLTDVPPRDLLQPS